MRYVRFCLRSMARDTPRAGGRADEILWDQVYWGAVEGERVRPLTASPFEGGVPGKASYALHQAVLRAPVVPGKILGIGLNYRDHAREMRHEIPLQPLLFLKSPNSIIGPGDPIRIPPESRRVDYEGELAVVIGRRGRRIPQGKAAQHILGYTVLNDVTARDLQKTDGQWARAKSYDTFCPLGPWVETELDTRDLPITTVVNGEPRQDSSTAEMVFSVPELVAFASSVMTLEPGDVIATGTPSGVGPLRAGDKVSVAVGGIGVLTNPVLPEEG